MVEAGKTRLTEMIRDENRESSLTAPAFQQLHLTLATVISTDDLVIGALLTYQFAKLLSQSKGRVQKRKTLRLIR
jgi:hypothetical protein